MACVEKPSNKKKLHTNDLIALYVNRSANEFKSIEGPGKIKNYIRKSKSIRVIMHQSRAVLVKCMIRLIRFLFHSSALLPYPIQVQPGNKKPDLTFTVFEWSPYSFSVMCAGVLQV